MIVTQLDLTADPAAGQEIVYTATEDVVVHAFKAVLVNSATVANRRPMLVADDGTTEFFRVLSQADFTASQTVNLTSAPGLPYTSVNSTLSLPLPTNGLRLRAGDRLRTITSGIQAGDNWSAAAVLVEHI